MRVALSPYGGCRDVEPLVALAAQLRALGAEVRVCVPPGSAQRLAEVGVPLVPAGLSVHGATPSSAADLPRWQDRPDAVGERALAASTSSSNDAPTTRSTGREPVICRPELSRHARGLRQAPGSCGKGQRRK